MSSANPKLSCPCSLVPFKAIGNSGLGKLHIFTNYGLFHTRKTSNFCQIQEPHSHHALAIVSGFVHNPDINGLKGLI